MRGVKMNQHVGHITGEALADIFNRSEKSPLKLQENQSVDGWVDVFDLPGNDALKVQFERLKTLLPPV